METTLIIIIAVLAGGIVAYFIFGKKEKKSENDTGLNLILAQLNELSRTVDSKLGESHKQVQEGE